jgi:SET domain-containing protein
MKKHLVVKKSKIEGKGLFTKSPLRKGTLLGRCKTEPATEPSPHTLWLEDDRLVDVTCKLKYINHDKKPNVAYYDDLSVVTLRAIRAGEELTHDYGDEWD